MKNSTGLASRTAGEPSSDAVRRAAATISRVGPPPPSPWPKGTSDRFATAFSVKFRSARARSAADRSEL